MSADTAPAAMPGEAEPNDAPCYLSASEASAWASGFNAAHQALAPILAEKERQLRVVQNAAKIIASAQGTELEHLRQNARFDHALRQEVESLRQHNSEMTDALLAAEAALAAERERCAKIAERFMAAGKFVGGQFVAGPNTPRAIAAAIRAQANNEPGA